MKGYAVDESWDDPFEHREERRVAPRFGVRFRLSITAEDPFNCRRIVGPAIVLNLSQLGALVRTKHILSAFQRVSLVVPTADCGDGAMLPETFDGTAVVLRSQPRDRDVFDVALRFGDDLAQNMEFVMFVDLLQAKSRTASGPQVA